MFRRLPPLLILIAALAALLGMAGRVEAREPQTEIRRTGLQLCDTQNGKRVCRAVDGPYNSMNGRDAVLTLTVDIPPAAIAPDRPLTVALTAMAASEIRWNGVPIGANGRPANDRAHEIPGRFEAVFAVPPNLVRPGLNTVSARVSSRWLLVPVQAPLHLFEVGPYQDPVRLGLMRYLPALGMAGVLALAALYFAVLAALDRTTARQERGFATPAGTESPGPGLLAAIAATALLQLVAETARVFFAYLYPWHVVRVAGIALLCAVTAVLIAAWAARRFAPDWRWAAPAVVAAACIPALLFAKGFDGKALVVFTLGQVALGACAALAVRRRPALAIPALVFAVAAISLAYWLNAMFLDGAYYLLLAAAFGLLVAAQAWSLWQARRAPTPPPAVSAPESQATLLVRDGPRTHRVPLAEIRYLKGADDYCEVHLDGGRTLLAASTLTRLAAALPDGFARIHKSYVIDTGRVRTLAPRPGGGRSVVLADGEVLPVGRSYAGELSGLGAAAGRI